MVQTQLVMALAGQKRHSFMTNIEGLALRDLHKESNIVIVPADKGRSMVVLNKSGCNRKAAALLCNISLRGSTFQARSGITAHTHGLQDYRHCCTSLMSPPRRQPGPPMTIGGVCHTPPFLSWNLQTDSTGLKFQNTPIFQFLLKFKQF